MTPRQERIFLGGFLFGLFAGFVLTLSVAGWWTQTQASALGSRYSLNGVALPYQRPHVSSPDDLGHNEFGATRIAPELRAMNAATNLMTTGWRTAELYKFAHRVPSSLLVAP